METQAVIFDLGGVVLGSPLHAIADFERASGLPQNFVNRVVAETAPTGAWSRLERGELEMSLFFDAFAADCRDAGHDLDVRALFTRMGEAAQPRQVMLEAISTLRGTGLKVAALTNNWANEQHDGPHDGTRALRHHFDLFVESSVEGLRKPDPRIYELVCRRMDVEPNRSIFLDDIGSNLKTAARLGMATIKVEDPEVALRQLGGLLDLVLLPA